MYLTDILTAKDLEGTNLPDVPREFLDEQWKRMRSLIDMAVELEHVHNSLLPSVNFAPGFLMYLDYIIYKNTTGPKN